MLTVLSQAVLSGAAVGAIYALLALGFSVTFSTTKTLNFSHGEFVSTGAFIYVAALILSSGQTNLLVPGIQAGAMQQAIALVAALAIMAALGALLYLVGVRPFVGKPGLAWVVSTIGFGIVLQSGVLALWGPGTVIVASPVGDGLVNVFGAVARRQELLVLGVAIVLVLLMDQLMRRTMLGRAMKAVAHNPAVASLMGINVTKVMIGSFAVSSALAALSGVLIAPIATASVYLGLAFGLKGFSAAIVGGLTNPRGCVIGGFLLGILEAMVNLWQAQWRDVVVFALVILVLVVRPTGLFGTRLVEKT